MHQIDEALDPASQNNLTSELADIRVKLEEIVEKDVRQVSLRLYPSILRRGLTAGLQSLADRFESAVTVDMELDADLTRRERTNSRLIPERVRLAAYRVAEEAFANVIKHSGASNVSVELTAPPDQLLRLNVRDDGSGFEPGAHSDGMGIGTMSDYAEVVGGTCVVTSSPGGGTTVSTVFPMSENGARPPKDSTPGSATIAQSLPVEPTEDPNEQRSHDSPGGSAGRTRDQLLRDFPYWESSGSKGSPNEIVAS